VWTIAFLLCAVFVGVAWQQSWVGAIVGAAIGLLLCVPSFVFKIHANPQIH
jgi:hypothetical protein